MKKEHVFLFIGYFTGAIGGMGFGVALTLANSDFQKMPENQLTCTYNHASKATNHISKTAPAEYQNQEFRKTINLKPN